MGKRFSQLLRCSPDAQTVLGRDVTRVPQLEWIPRALSMSIGGWSKSFCARSAVWFRSSQMNHCNFLASTSSVARVLRRLYHAKVSVLLIGFHAASKSFKHPGPLAMLFPA